MEKLSEANLRCNVWVIFGTRPEAIKMAPVIAALKMADWVDVRVLVTGQHVELMNDVLEVFGIEPDFIIKSMIHGQSVAELFAKMVAEISSFLGNQKVDFVLVHGDTASTFAAAVSAFLGKIPLGHVEAGLRTNNLASPWPEEGFRQMVSKVVRVHFAPTEFAKQNLLREGVLDRNILVTGNTVIDALISVRDQIMLSDDIFKVLVAKYSGLSEILGFSKLLLVTCHRRENWGTPAREIALGLAELLSDDKDLGILVVSHPNQAIREAFEAVAAKSHQMLLLPALNYAEFAAIMIRATLILTDSGGIQEEAPSLNKPVLVLREATERPEGETSGAIKVIGCSQEAIVSQVHSLLGDKSSLARMASAENPYGDGNASIRIVDWLYSHMSLKTE